MQDPRDCGIKPVEEHEVEQKLKEGWHGPFKVGELLPWKGTWFKVREIYEDGIFLEVTRRGRDARDKGDGGETSPLR